MAKTADTSVAAEFPLSLNEYCTRLSVNDKRVELIGAFEYVERNAGRLKDTETNYNNRFAAFVSKPA